MLQSTIELAPGHQDLLLFTVAKHLPEKADCQILTHAQTTTAAQKQYILPAGVAVQKTLTLQVDQKIILVSGYTDFTLGQVQKRAIARCVGARTHARFHINPAHLSAEKTTGLPYGMVSPFLPPGFASPLQAVVILPDVLPGAPFLALSLSLDRSLLVPTTSIEAILSEYASRIYPQIPLHFLR